MRRRGLYLCKILFICLLMGACSKAQNLPQKSTQTSDRVISSKETIKGASTEGIKDTPRKVITDEENMNIDDIEILKKDKEKTMSVKEGKNEKNNKIEANKDDLIITYNNLNETHDIDKILREYRHYPAGTILDITVYDQELVNSLFIVEELSQDIIKRIDGKSYKEDADIPHSDLRYIKVLHLGFDGETYVGEMIVNKAIADDVIDIFRDLYSISYPIEKMLLIDEYNADDNKSMEDNNSSAFNFRFIDGTTRRSVHSDGLAIDINPLYNPYVRTRDGEIEVLPEGGWEYLDRDQENEYYIRKGDSCYQAFISKGFTWGGEWNNSKDYQHFEKKLAE